MRYVRIEVKGIVQGVGFRPFIYRLAKKHKILGRVSNNTRGVEILACGKDSDMNGFIDAIKSKAPPQALIEELSVGEIDPFHASSFEIASSRTDGEKEVLISPDLATCTKCVSEIFDSSNRRYRYPFTNCTNCGPRFTIIKDTPYDRPNTSMAKFKMCADCEREYNDPADRRFHAQPNACPSCGPHLLLVDREGRIIEGDPITMTANLLDSGKIVAIKGLGGFHLACDASSREVVAELRGRKQRFGKPFAVMVRDIGEAKRCCKVSPEAEEILNSPRRPIVLLPEKEGSIFSKEVAPGLSHQGVFLPYTPVHHLIMKEVSVPLVMTSGNVSSEPICIDNDEAIERLSGIADFFLLHNRDILVRYDDSVVHLFKGKEYPVRRARGYAPYPLRVQPPSKKTILAFGPELKNTFCILRGEQAFLSQHIGDMETAYELEHFEEALASIKRLFSLEPEIAVHDLHPDYLTTQLARESGLPCVGVQHHHAHIASCIADNLLEGEVLGVAWDGTGYGDDGTIWGGEFLKANLSSFERLAHLYTYPMPGGDAAIFRIYRIVAGVLFELSGRDLEKTAGLLNRLFRIDEKEIEAINFQISSGFNCPLSSSSGRAFDAVAALVGLRSEAVYDGQAACELEAISFDCREYYNFEIDDSKEPFVVDTRPIFDGVLSDVFNSVDAGEISSRFHETMARLIIETCLKLAEDTGLKRVALSGGVFQNIRLLTRVFEGLEEKGLKPYVHRRVPANDGGISLGQAMVAASISSCE